MKTLFFLAAMLLAIGLMAPSALMANMALELDGNSAIEVPNSDSLNPKKAITIEAWMKMEKDNGECLAKDWGGQRDYIFPEIVGGGTKLRFVLWPGTKILDAPGFELNKWMHAAGVWDGKQMRVYINGEEVGTVDYDAAELNASDASLYIGVGDSQQWTCKGLMDEIRIWEVARTEAEIQETMNVMLRGNEPGLVTYYPFEGNDNDMTSNGNHGQVAFGEPKYVDVTAELALEPVPVTSVSVKDKLTNTWAKVKQMR